MRYYESKNGYKYKEYKNGKKVRISDKEYNKLNKLKKIGGSKSPINIAKEKTKICEDVFKYLNKHQINYDQPNVVDSINKELMNGNKDFKNILIQILKLENPVLENILYRQFPIEANLLDLTDYNVETNPLLNYNGKNPRDYFIECYNECSGKFKMFLNAHGELISLGTQNYYNLPKYIDIVTMSLHNDSTFMLVTSDILNILFSDLINSEKTKRITNIYEMFKHQYDIVTRTGQIQDIRLYFTYAGGRPGILFLDKNNHYKFIYITDLFDDIEYGDNITLKYFVDKVHKLLFEDNIVNNYKLNSSNKPKSLKNFYNKKKIEIILPACRVVLNSDSNSNDSVLARTISSKRKSGNIPINANLREIERKQRKQMNFNKKLSILKEKSKEEEKHIFLLKNIDGSEIYIISLSITESTNMTDLLSEFNRILNRNNENNNNVIKITKPDSNFIKINNSLISESSIEVLNSQVNSTELVPSAPYLTDLEKDLFPLRFQKSISNQKSPIIYLRFQNVVIKRNYFPMICFGNLNLTQVNQNGKNETHIFSNLSASSYKWIKDHKEKPIYLDLTVDNIEDFLRNTLKECSQEKKHLSFEDSSILLSGRLEADVMLLKNRLKENLIKKSILIEYTIDGNSHKGGNTHKCGNTHKGGNNIRYIYLGKSLDKKKINIFDLNYHKNNQMIYIFYERKLKS